MKAFCMDVHISIIADFKDTFRSVEITDWCLSGHAWVFNRKQDTPLHINAQTWRNFNQEMIERFQVAYDSFLNTFDFFIVGYASCFAMLYEKYNKPIVMLNAVRSDIPFCWNLNSGMLADYKAAIRRMHDNGTLRIISNGKADHLYTKACLGIESEIIPSLCLYTGIRYDPRRCGPQFLCYNGTIPQHPLVVNRAALRNFQWSTIAGFRGIIHFPYEPNTMSIFEHFSGGMPLFFPSKSYWKSHPNIQSISAYWGKNLPDSLQEFADPSVWIELSDVYTTFASPNTYYFDSIPHLFELLQSFVYRDDREFRAAYIQTTKEKWKRALGNIVSQ